MFGRWLSACARSLERGVGGLLAALLGISILVTSLIGSNRSEMTETRWQRSGISVEAEVTRVGCGSAAGRGCVEIYYLTEAGPRTSVLGPRTKNLEGRHFEVGQEVKIAYKASDPSSVWLFATEVNHRKWSTVIRGGFVVSVVGLLLFALWMIRRRVPIQPERRRAV